MKTKRKGEGQSQRIVSYCVGKITEGKERDKMKSQNKKLHKAKKSKRDEFYTRLSDIERELMYYEEHFKDKTVYCNCDDPRISKFFHYFSFKFEDLELKKLITTCYKSRNPDMFSRNDVEQAIYIEYKRDENGQLVPYPEYMKSVSEQCLYKGDKNNPNIPRPEDIGIGFLKGDGDFRSAETIELLKQADIVVTNPPFSLFREYVAQLVEYDKKFVIIGNKNAITYKEIFKLIKEDKMWIGNTPMGINILFDVPEDYAREMVETKKEGSGYKMMDGAVKGLSPAVWFTNLDIYKRHEEMILYKDYTPEAYPKYDNYDAIEVSKTMEIPMDYSGAMGVPISFLDKYNPEQFEILGIDRVLIFEKTGKVSRFFIAGKEIYARIVIKNKKL